jgi:hypothetical protein
VLRLSGGAAHVPLTLLYLLSHQLVARLFEFTQEVERRRPFRLAGRRRGRRRFVVTAPDPLARRRYSYNGAPTPSECCP